MSAEPGRAFDFGAGERPEHVVQFYEESSDLLASVSGFVRDGVDCGAGAIVIATAEHCEGLQRTWSAQGFDFAGARDRQQMLMLDAAETLARFMRDGSIQHERFFDVIGPVIAAARSRYPRLVAFGEMVGLLWNNGLPGMALELEDLWNELASHHAFTLLCAYPLHARTGRADTLPFQGVCTRHSHVIAPEGRVSIAPEPRRRAVSGIRRKAQVLEREIDRRRDIEALLAQRDRELSDFLDCALEGLRKLGPDGTILWANRTELELLGYPVEEYVGRPFEQFFADPGEGADFMRQLLTGEPVANLPATLRCRDGSVRHVLMSSNSFRERGRLVYIRCFTRDLTEQLLAELRLSEEQARLAAIVESSDDAIISKTLDGIIRSWNSGAVRLFGYSPEEAIGQPITLIIPPEEQDEEKRILERLRRGERIDHFETIRVAKDGRRVNISLSVSPIRDATGRIVGASKIARDITERKQAEQALREADRRKDEFLAVLAHELRNPLAPIRYAVAMSAKSGRTQEQQVRAQEIIARQVSHMSRLLDDLLDVSRITRGTLELKTSRIELTSAIAAAVEAARPILDAKAHVLSLDLPEHTVRLEADPVRMAQILANLLINAAKYTDPGGQIQLRAAAEGDGVVIRVRDNGIGISPEMKPKLFTLFTQARSALERSEGGLGIGLALVRGLVALHGGTVEAHSAGLNQGSEFVVRLPLGSLSDAQPSQDAADVAVGADGSGAALQIIVADDNRDSAETCAGLLQLCGHEVRQVHDGRRALELAEQFRPAALVLDIGMPELNGYEVARRIRAAAWGRDMLLIAITGWGQENDKRRALEAGFDHHLTKPIDPAALEGLLQSHGTCGKDRPAA